LDVGLIGCGAIGSSLALAIVSGKAGDITLRGICDTDAGRVDKLNKQLNLRSLILTNDSDKLIAQKNIDLIVEAASPKVVELVAEKVLSSGKHLFMMSVGALREEKLLKKLEYLAKENNVKIYAPSGAICGLDGVKSASVENIESVEIISTKSPKSLQGSPYLVENNIDISNLTDSKIVFEGDAYEAAKGFPQNVNVAVALSLAGIGVKKTKVKIIADPKATKTKHEIRVKGDFGELYTCVINSLHPENPKTSYLAALSAIRTLRKISEPLQLGT